MQEKSQDQEITKVMAWLAEKLVCPLCSYQYNLERISVVPQNLRKNREVVVHTNCGSCECSLLFALDIRGGEVFLVGVVTDLTPTDAEKFFTMTPIGADDILDWHYFWKDCSGDFEMLLR